MFIASIIHSPSIREATRIETVQPRAVNVKKLKKLNRMLAAQYINARYHGGRLYLGKGVGSWLKNAYHKTKRFAKAAFNKVIKPAYTKVIKPGLNFLTKNELGKAITKTASDVIGSAVSAIPVVGAVAGPVVSKSLPTVLESADNITTAAENVIKSIRDKNPQVTISQAKEVVNTIKNTYNTLNEEAKKVKAEQMKQIDDNIADAIKAEGFASVLKAAPFLPLVDLTTLRQEEGTTKGGKVKQAYKIRKPTGADKYGKYSAPIVARVCGRIFLGGVVRPNGKPSTSSVLEQLRAKYL